MAYGDNVSNNNCGDGSIMCQPNPNGSGVIVSVVAHYGLISTVTSDGTVDIKSKPDDITIEVNTSSDVLQVKDKGITFAKMQDISTGKLLGRSSSGTGPIEMVDESDPIARAKTVKVTGTSPIDVSGGQQSLDSNPDFTVTHNNSGVSPGTYNNLTVNATGHVTNASNIDYLTEYIETDPVANTKTIRLVPGTGIIIPENALALGINPVFNVSANNTSTIWNPSSGSNFYIQNGAAPQTAATFNITGTGTIGNGLTVTNGTTSITGDITFATTASGGIRMNFDEGNTTGDLFYRASSGKLTPLHPGSNTQVLTLVGGLPAWVTPTSGSGTVTSVGLTTPAMFSVTGSPVTGSGTLAMSLTNQNANIVFAGPASGAAATPTFRALAPLDIPNLDTSKLTSGILGVARGGTGLGAIGTGGQLLRTNVGATALEYFTPTYISANQTITLSGDVTGSGTTAIATTIANNAVSYAKMQDMTNNRLLGRYAGTTGDPQEVSLGTNISITGGVLDSPSDIHNNTTLQTSANFNISGIGKAASFRVNDVGTTAYTSRIPVFEFTGTDQVFGGDYGGNFQPFENVGIGLYVKPAGSGWPTNPQFTWEDAGVTVTPTVRTSLINSTTGPSQLKLTGNSILLEAPAASARLLANSSGITVTGDCTISGNCTSAGFYQSSMKSIKQNIKDFKEDATAIVNGLKIKSFEYKANPGTTVIGIIADDSHELVAGKRRDHFDLMSAAGIMIKSIQELTERINKIEHELGISSK